MHIDSRYFHPYMYSIKETSLGAAINLQLPRLRQGTILELRTISIVSSTGLLTDYYGTLTLAGNPHVIMYNTAVAVNTPITFADMLYLTDADELSVYVSSIAAGESIKWLVAGRLYTPGKTLKAVRDRK